MQTNRGNKRWQCRCLQTTDMVKFYIYLCCNFTFLLVQFSILIQPCAYDLVMLKHKDLVRVRKR